MSNSEILEVFRAAILAIDLSVALPRYYFYLDYHEVMRELKCHPPSMTLGHGDDAGSNRITPVSDVASPSRNLSNFLGFRTEIYLI